jgi:hypothetical protein
VPIFEFCLLYARELELGLKQITVELERSGKIIESGCAVDRIIKILHKHGVHVSVDSYLGLMLDLNFLKSSISLECTHRSICYDTWD